MAKKNSVPAVESTTKKTTAPRKAAVPKRHSKATPTVPEVQAEPVAAEPVLDSREVARLAYSYWVARNFQPGSQVEDWFRAENELRQRLNTR